MVLVDHNEKDQAVDNIDKAEIMEIIDHHKLGTLQTMQPISFRNQPVGCTGTIMYQMYGEQKLEIPPKNRGASLCCDHFRYTDVPFTDLYTAGQDGCRCTCTYCRHFH